MRQETAGADIELNDVDNKRDWDGKDEVVLRSSFRGVDSPKRLIFF